MAGGVGFCRILGFLWLVLAAIVFLAAPTHAIAPNKTQNAKREIVAAFVRNWPPQYKLNEKGKPVGFARDILVDIAALAGVRVRFRIVDTFPQALRELKQGNVDLIPNLDISVAHASVGRFTAPVETSAVSVFVRQDAAHIESFDDLRGQRVGFVRSSAGIDMISNIAGAIPMLRRDLRSALIDLVAGQLDAVIFSKPVFLKVARQLKREDRVRILGAPLQEIKRAILVAKTDRLLWSELDKAVRRYVGTRDYERIYSKWYGAPVSFWTAPRVAWVMGGLAAIGLLASFGWRFLSVARLNRRLTEQTAILRAVLENVDQGISLFDAEMNSVAFNDRFTELLNLPREVTQIGVPFDSFVRVAAERGDYGPGDAEAQVRERVEIAKRFEPRNFVRQGQNGLTIDVRSNPIPGGGFVTTYTDITDQMRVEDALRISERQLSEAQRIGHIGHWRYLTETRRFESSKAFNQIYGWDPERFTATFTAISDAVPPDDRARIDAIRKDAGKRKVSYRCEFRIVRPDGDIRFVRGEGQPEFDGSGRLVSFFGVNQDITEQKQIEEELLRERTRAELANSAKSEFLANMSHEIRTPLNAIIGFADIIEKEIFGPIGNEKYAEYISYVHASAEHLLDLVTDILDISTIEAGEMALTPEMLDLATMFDECARVVREQAHKAELTLSIALPDRDASVYADHRAVRQILLNLLSNAIKFTPPGGEVTLGAVASEENFTIFVSDTGVGIPAQYISTITQPFETGSDDPHASTKGNPYIRSKGTGLGLAIVRSLANLHGGDVAIESEEGKGTTVRVWVPHRTREAA